MTDGRLRGSQPCRGAPAQYQLASHERCRQRRRGTSTARAQRGGGLAEHGRSDAAA